MLKRLWDTENKKVVWAVDKSDHKKVYQVWTNDDGSKLYIYKKNGWVELDQTKEDVKEYWPVWKELEDETVGYYLTNEPTNLYNWDSGDEVAYRFMNWTTVLQSWKVDEWETPEYTGDTPTKSATAQYTYTFSGWKPTVWPISKKTDFKAQFTSTVNEYTVSIASNDIDMWTVSESSVADVPYGTALSIDDNVLTIGSGESAVNVTATANAGHYFSDWWEVPDTVIWATSITATFEPEEYEITIEANDPTYWTLDIENLTATYGNSISASSNVLTIGETEITALAEEWYTFSSWTDNNGDPLPATVSGALSIVAVFETL